MALIHDQGQINELINSLRLHLPDFIGLFRRLEMIGKYTDALYMMIMPTIQLKFMRFFKQHVTSEIPIEETATYRNSHEEYVNFLILLHCACGLSFGDFCSRLAALKDDFVFASSYADHIVVTAVQYLSHHSCNFLSKGTTNIIICYVREVAAWNVCGTDLAASIIGPPSEYIPAQEDVIDKLAIEMIQDPLPQIVNLTLGAVISIQWAQNYCMNRKRDYALHNLSKQPSTHCII